MLSGLVGDVWSGAVRSELSGLRSSGLNWDVPSDLGCLVQPSLDDQFAEIRLEAV